MTDYVRPLSYRARQQRIARMRRKVRRQFWLQHHGMPPAFRRGFKWALVLLTPFWLGVGWLVWRHL